jgi:TRAP-type mannitol/chloroaromatic compound transport system permease small subunit
MKKTPATNTIDKVNQRTGEVAQWFMIATIVIVLIDVVMRYIFNRPPMWTRDIMIMTSCATGVLSWGEIERRDMHIRVDLVYERLSTKGKAIMDLVSALLFFFPLMLWLAYVSFQWAVEAWRTNEKSTETLWYPPLAPLRTVVFIGICLYILQAVGQFIKYIRVIRNHPLNIVDRKSDMDKR